MHELCPSSHTKPHRRGLPHTRRDSLSTSLSRSLPERCWCVSMMPATPPPPLPSAAITARRRATDALSAGQLVALAGDDAAILQSWLRLPAMMQSDDWHVSRTRLWPVSCQPCGCSRVEDFSEGIGRTLMSLSRWLFEMYCISGDHDVKKVRIICQNGE